MQQAVEVIEAGLQRDTQGAGGCLGAGAAQSVPAARVCQTLGARFSASATPAAPAGAIPFADARPDRQLRVPPAGCMRLKNRCHAQFLPAGRIYTGSRCALRTKGLSYCPARAWLRRRGKKPRAAAPARPSIKAGKRCSRRRPCGTTNHNPNKKKKKTNQTPNTP